jgi:protoporphyrinogen/coproporphyrinogen III oxidase
VGNSDSKSIAVLGGGITGLAAAYRLTTLGHRVRLFEQGARLGGVIQSELTDGWLIEAGPNSFQESSPGVTALLEELGLGPERIVASPAAHNRYLVRRGRLVPLPLSPLGLIASPLLSVGAKLRVLVELMSSRRVRTTDLSVAAFARSHFGQEVLDYVVQPFVGGIYAGNAEKLSTRYAFPRLWQLEQTHGSLLRGQLAAAKQRRARGEPASPPLISFRRGLQALPDALAVRLPPDAIVRQARVDGLVPGTRWQVIWHDGRITQFEPFDAVVSALPAPALAQLTIGPLAEKPLVSLESVAHPSVTSLFLGFQREQVRHPLAGFGVLVPAVEKRAVLGVIFSSSLFPGRAPPGHVALTVMLGGALRPDLALLPPEKLWSAVRGDLYDLLHVTGEPVFQRSTRWPQAIPQYQLGHERHFEAITACERANPGLFIGGNVRDGIALPSCVLGGLQLAERAGA